MYNKTHKKGNLYVYIVYRAQKARMKQSARDLGEACKASTLSVGSLEIGDALLKKATQALVKTPHTAL